MLLNIMKELKNDAGKMELFMTGQLQFAGMSASQERALKASLNTHKEAREKYSFGFWAWA
ncbi:hypothetical protein [Paenibacillus sp. UMB4589-SE434]|uniref:hypothetical protein n=1 Tax=Paenibacillus sp. UMB4589-SE434 TaxID=3046314 RepID=UPI00254F5653|nr:hypothetical protein [Paenibacillus sp. UMB4589-SE434]MDK8182998.1 hypothetical protein [Paenibacillus sp. UMB4589-SE434]